MPCFKGLAVSIHTTDGPIPEYSIQKNNRVSRIATYIPVPQPQLSTETGRPAPSTFAISITLLIPGQEVPYSKPPPSPENPDPNFRRVGLLPGSGEERGKYSIIGPYIPLTQSSNETIAAYIHFDGRAKEEVATLLRRGEETWVNSRWVSVPDAEGGGLAEREFLFREVGLERWLNGLDLKGGTQEVAERIERRKRRLEKKRQKKLSEQRGSEDDADMLGGRTGRGSILRYGEDKTQPIEAVDNDMSLEDSDSEDEMPVPEAAGQIKVSLYRVLASGEVKRGEYSPQFDAHDDDDMDKDQGEGGGNDADVDHTTTFAKPKTLDPKTISTQTVTGIDPPDKPYATFTFFYRGKKQLQKMGILATPASEASPATAPRKSKQLDAASLGTLTSNKGTIGFSGYRDAHAKAADPFRQKKKRSAFNDGSDMDEDSDDDNANTFDHDHKPEAANGKSKGEAADTEDAKNVVLSAEEISKRGELAEGVKKMQLKRQHSFEPPEASSATLSSTAPSIAATGDSLAKADLPGDASPVNGGAGTNAPTHLAHLSEPVSAASPFKKARASVSEKEPISSFAARMNSLTGQEIREHDAAAAASNAPCPPGLLAAAPLSGGSTGSLPAKKPDKPSAEEKM